MMEVTDVQPFNMKKYRSVTINLHHVLSISTMYDLAVFVDFKRNTVGVNSQQKNYVIPNVLESFV